MSNKIDSMTQQYLQIAGRPAETHAKGKAPEGNVTASNPVQPDNTDTIKLTDGARQLQALEKMLSEVSEVDHSRVEAVRHRIESGQYEVSPERIADRMIVMDRALPDAK